VVVRNTPDEEYAQIESLLPSLDKFPDITWRQGLEVCFIGFSSQQSERRE
jgi:hypothetical protein